MPGVLTALPVMLVLLCLLLITQDCFVSVHRCKRVCYWSRCRRTIGMSSEASHRASVRMTQKTSMGLAFWASCWRHCAERPVSMTLERAAELLRHGCCVTL